MKIILLHGLENQKSYTRLTSFINVAKKRGWDIVNDKIEDTPSLFGTEKLIIIRDLKVLNKKELELIKKIPGTLIIYLDKEAPKTLLDSLPKDITIEKFDTPKLLWKFLNNVTLKGFHEIIEYEAVEFVFIMIFWKVKNEYLKTKSAKYAQIIKKMADIDARVKIGKANLIDELDLLILKHLE